MDTTTSAFPLCASSRAMRASWLMVWSPRIAGRPRLALAGQALAGVRVPAQLRAPRARQPVHRPGSPGAGFVPLRSWRIRVAAVLHLDCQRPVLVVRQLKHDRLARPDLLLTEQKLMPLDNVQ